MTGRIRATHPNGFGWIDASPALAEPVFFCARAVDRDGPVAFDELREGMPVSFRLEYPAGRPQGWRVRVLDM